jgi:hypothetical protein
VRHDLTFLHSQTVLTIVLANQKAENEFSAPFDARGHSKRPRPRTGGAAIMGKKTKAHQEGTGIRVVHPGAKTTVAPIFAGAVFDTSASENVPLAETKQRTKKMKAPERGKTAVALETARQQREVRLAGDSARATDPSETERALKAVAGAPPPAVSRPTTARTPLVIPSPSKILSGCAPPDLEMHMRALALTLPAKVRGKDHYAPLDTDRWPSVSVNSPSECLSRVKNKRYGPPSTTTFIDGSVFGIRPSCEFCGSCEKVVASTWVLKPVFGVGRRDYVMIRPHRCVGCPKSGEVHSPTIPFKHFYQQAGLLTLVPISAAYQAPRSSRCVAVRRTSACASSCCSHTNLT